MSENLERRYSVEQPPTNGQHEADNGFDRDAYNESIYTPYELSRLRAFENILVKAREMEDRLKDGKPQAMKWIVKDKDGKTTSSTPLWDDNWAMVWHMKNMAFHMYSGNDVEDEETGEITHIPGLRDSEKLKEASEMVLNGFREDATNAAKFEVLELENLFDIDVK